MSVGIVTDSTAVLSRESADEAGIAVVPLQVIVDDDELVDGAESSGPTIAEAMRARRAVTTSRPTPHAFVRAYESLAASGVDEIVSVHLSDALSGTCDSARSAAADAPVPVHVVDSRTLAMGMGFGVLAGAATARAGGSSEAVVAEVERVCSGSRVLLYVDTLEHLRRGGRIGGAAALVGSALSIKPILHLKDGVLEPLERVRTASKAIARLEALSVERVKAITATGAQADVAVHHLAVDERASALRDRLTETLGIAVEVHEVGGVLGAHVGPGTIAVAIAPH